jgi:hypothetical protein
MYHREHGVPDLYAAYAGLEPASESLRSPSVIDDQAPNCVS